MRTCKVCRKRYTATLPMQTACSTDCAIVRAKKINQAKQRKEDSLKRASMKNRSKWIQECQALVNKYARLRDMQAGHGCISCGATWRNIFGGAFDAGHYRSTGSAPHLRFNLKNIHLQCSRCNRYLGGNVVEYRRGLVARKGADYVETLESMQGEARWTVEYLERLKKVFSKKILRLKKRMA